ncbi:hypothetical protein [Microbacterium gorillae]|uniref:hypothetical protein n=1 Tax=Microbacterium gorillae TaxID=1231063 RepID=UPI003D977297
MNGEATAPPVPSHGTDEISVWGDVNWVPASESRRYFLHTVLLLVPLAVGGALMAAGAVMLGLKQISSVWLLGSGLLILALVAALAPLWNTYRRAPASTVGATVFHVTAAEWAVGDVVTMKAHRGRQYVADRAWGRRMPLVYVFPERPTIHHAKGQTLHGRRRSIRYLYELEVQNPPAAVYRRSSAVAIPHDLVVTVLSKEKIPEQRRRRRRGA